MRKSVFFAVLISCVTTAFGVNPLGVDFFDAGDMARAKSIFLSEPMDARSSYYLGEIYWKQSKKDSASYYFRKGLEIDPLYAYNQIGLGKCTLATDAKSAAAYFKAATSAKDFKKDAKVYAAIALAYNANGDTANYNNFMTKAHSVNLKDPIPYVLEGNVLAAKKRIGDAAGRYDNALYFDPNCKVANLKLGQIYAPIKIKLAVDYFNKAIATDPNYAVAYSELAKSQYRKGFYPEALQAYEKYMSLVKPTQKDYEQYATILYFNKDKKDETIAAIDKANSNSTVMNRLKAYIYMDKGDDAKALELFDDFMVNTDQEDLIYLDYANYAKLLSKQKLYAKAIPNYVAALKVDSTHFELNRDLVDAYEKNKNYDQAISTYKLLQTNPTTNDIYTLYNLGKCYYKAAQDSSLIKNKPKANAYAMSSDSVFNVMTQLRSDNYLGYFWRARVQLLLEPDPENTTGLSKPYYEKAADILLAQNKQSNPDLQECYRYLGSYYFAQKDFVNSKEYFNKILEINPKDDKALENVKGLDVLIKKGK